MKKIHTFCCCVFVLFIFKAKAQTDDYVITVKGDTLKCSISFPLIGPSKYKVPGGESEKLDHAKIKEYYITRKDLLKRVVFMGDKTKSDFLEVVENGSISLYKIVYNNGKTSTVEWYVGKASDRVSALKTSGLFLGKSRKDRKDDFAEMLQDKPEVYNKYMAENKFSFNAIQNLVHLYNTGKSLKEEKTVEPKKDDAY